MSTPPTHRRPKVQNHEILVMVMLTSHDLAELTRRSETTVHRWGRDGTEGFPKPIVAEGTTRDSSQEGGETSYGTATWALAHHP